MNVAQLYHTRRTILQAAAFGLCMALAVVFSARAYAESNANCQAPKVASTQTPPDLRINGNNLESPLSTMMATPGKPITINYLPRDLSISLAIEPSAGRLVQLNESQWQLWPNMRKPSYLQLCAGTFYSRLQILPGVRNPKLTQRYPAPAKAPSPSAYQRPQRFIQVTSTEQSKTQLSPHFQLWQFLAPGNGQQWPQTTLISMPLLEKLELVMTVLAEHQKPAQTLHILSGYRSPAHNRQVGGAPYSRHQYGDAVDFIVDADKDGTMDDLNDDGQVDRADLDWLMDRLARRSIPVSAGGMGRYESNGVAAAFIHLDARGRDRAWQ